MNCCTECGHVGNVVALSDNGYRVFLCKECAPDAWEYLKAVSEQCDEEEVTL